MGRKHVQIMRKIGWYAAGAFIALHGLAHFIGTMILFDSTHELYRTTILWGTIDFGGVGTLVWGGLYTASGVAFVVAAVGMILHQWWWRRLLLPAVLVSLLLTFGDIDRAHVGFVINIALLIGLIVHTQMR